MNRAELLAKLNEAYEIVMGQKLPENGIDMNTDLRTDLGLSSIGMLYFVITMETLFSVRFEGVGVEDFKTIGDVADYIEKHSSL